MKKRILLIATLIGTMAMLSACGEEEAEKEEVVVGGNIMADVNIEDYVTTLAEYKGVEIGLPTTELVVPDEAIDAEIQNALNAQAVPTEIKDRAVESGDVVNIDYIGTIDDVAFEGGTAESYDLEIGSGSFIPGFEDGVIGASLGKTIDVEVTFPDPYQNPEMSGAAAVFSVTVNSITQYDIPELTDELLVTMAPDYKTVEEYRQSISETLLEQVTELYNSEVSAMALQNVVENSVITEPPSALVDKYIEQSMNSLESEAAYYQQTAEEYLAISGFTLEEFEKEISGNAVLIANENLVFRAIATKEGFMPTAAEILEFAETEYIMMGLESAEAFIEQVGEEEIEIYLIVGKVLELVGAEAIVSEEAQELETEEEVTEPEEEVTETEEEVTETEEEVAETE